ncbi:ABC transporter permease [Panacibacter ginsenosidivorans]|uniref:ABC transporter permease n=1 Tax=Panacibacter ginsenosidivorans TaxID=1813871 RepID=UPI0018644C24|nr:ABC transporter permease [Panacibacter ginsenosidivorans]
MGILKCLYEKKELDVDTGFFSLFSFPLIKGTPATVLKNLNSVVLTESTAKKYFGSVDNAMANIITLNKEIPLKVTGIAKDVKLLCVFFLADPLWPSFACTFF